MGLLEGAAISEPFVDRLCLTSTHSDTEPNLLDIDNDSIQSSEQQPPSSSDRADEDDDDDDHHYHPLSSDEVPHLFFENH